MSTPLPDEDQGSAKQRVCPDLKGKRQDPRTGLSAPHTPTWCPGLPLCPAVLHEEKSQMKGHMDRTHVENCEASETRAGEDSQQISAVGEGHKETPESEKNRVRTGGPETHVLSTHREPV